MRDLLCDEVIAGDEEGVGDQLVGHLRWVDGVPEHVGRRVRARPDKLGVAEEHRELHLPRPSASPLRLREP